MSTEMKPTPRRSILFIAVLLLAVLLFVGSAAISVFFFNRHITESNLYFSHQIADLQKNLTAVQEQLREQLQKQNTGTEQRLTSDPYYTQLYLRLAAVQKQIEQLPLLLVLAPKSELPAISINETDMTMWEKAWQNAWKTLRQLVVVYRLPSSATLPLIAPDQGSYIYQNIHAALSGAMWAVLYQDENIYRVSLQQVVEWVRRYFILDTPASKAALSELSALQAIPSFRANGNG